MFSTMKNVFRLVGLTTLLAAGTASAQIDGTKHDLATLSTGDNGEICVYCHTPHGSNTGVAAPLWNKNTNASGFTRYSALNTGMDSAEAPVGSVSLACLSCHDGTQAMDTVWNAPGSGGYNSSGAAMGALGTMAAGIANLGKDLRNDHPISIQYAGGGLSSLDGNGATGTGNFGDADFNEAYKAVINGPVWWVDTSWVSGNTTMGETGVREKTDMILYTRSSAEVSGNAATTEPFVECGSCHDPHSAANGTFLRVSNQNSGVCLACHNK